GQDVVIILFRERAMNESDLPLVEQAPVAVVGRDHHKPRAVERDMPLDQGQGAFADRAEADHDDRSFEAGMERSAFGRGGGRVHVDYSSARGGVMPRTARG